ncbi:unnamed protein product, partial [Musa acuminata var. zebrina]
FEQGGTPKTLARRDGVPPPWKCLQSSRLRIDPLICCRVLRCSIIREVARSKIVIWEKGEGSSFN